MMAQDIIENLKEVITIQEVSAFGVLLAFVVYLIYQARAKEKAHKIEINKYIEERNLISKELQESRDDLLIAVNESKTDAMDFQEKYYTLAAKILNRFDHFYDELRRVKT